tara:strand:- start:1979 stop:2287 length:309 start_codon:yes stop_codon:yes gene_type:complete
MTDVAKAPSMQSERSRDQIRKVTEMEIYKKRIITEVSGEVAVQTNGVTKRCRASSSVENTMLAVNSHPGSPAQRIQRGTGAVRNDWKKLRKSEEAECLFSKK